MSDGRRGFRGPHLRRKDAPPGRQGFQGPHLEAAGTAKDRRGFQGLRLLLDDKESHSVLLHSPDVMRRIAEKAYTLWTKRGCPQGSNLPDWIVAEKAEMDRIS